MFKFKYQKAPKTVVEEEGKVRKKFSKGFIIGFLIYLAFFFTCYGCYLGFITTYSLSTVQGISMKPTINPNDSVSTQGDSDDIVYVNRNKVAEREDVIILRNQQNSEGTAFIKRVIAKEGDWVSIYRQDDGYYHVVLKKSGSEEVEVLQEDYILSYADWNTMPSFPSDPSGLPGSVVYQREFYNRFIGAAYANTTINGAEFFKVPEGDVFYLGDNRAHSSDARAFGTADEGDVLGVVEIIAPNGAHSFGAKLKAILGHYWNKVVGFFSR